MNFLIELYKDHKLKINSIVIIIIYTIIYISLIGNYLSDYIDKNWFKLKNKPYLIPISGLLNKGKGDTAFTKTVNNFNAILSNIIRKCMHIILKPFFYLLKLITKITGNIKTTLDNFRNMAAITRKLFKITVEKTAERISNAYAAIIYFQEKFKLIIKKQAAMFGLYRQYALSLRFLLYSFINGPIPKITQFLIYYGIIMLVLLAFCVLCTVGGPFIAMFACPLCLCFDENTYIKSKNGNKQIKLLTLNEPIKGGGDIIGIIEILAGNTDMYNYNDIIVSGSHLVYENSWIRVEDSTIAYKISYPPNKHLYCLITKNNIISTSNIDNTIFSDYQESNNKTINNFVNRQIIKYLNNGIEFNTHNDIYHQYYWGFKSNTLLKTHNGFKNISEIIIGDKLNDDIVIGIVKLSGKYIELYNYNGIIVSGNQAVCENDLWLRVHQSKYSVRLNNKIDTLYHLITNKNRLVINNHLFTDFCETHNNTMNDFIDNYILQFKNTV